MRLQVFLSQSGACSRRKALAFILEGKVTVHHQKILEPSYPVDPLEDTVMLEGRRIILLKKVYILLNKPAGVMTTKADRFAQKTVMDLLPLHLRYVYPVGRLDKDTTGLLLLTNDGELAHRMMHPSFETEKTYRAVLDRPVSASDKKKLEAGVMLDDQKTHPCVLRMISAKEAEIVIHEGRKRQVRRMFALLHYHVFELSRIRQGVLTLGSLKIGEWRHLDTAEVKKLRETLLSFSR